MTTPPISPVPKLPHSCGKCTNRWSGTSTAHCGAGCCRTFSSPTSFDAHRIRSGSRAGTCADPTTVGLVLVDRGGYQVWSTPLDEAAVARFAARREARNAH